MTIRNLSDLAPYLPTMGHDGPAIPVRVLCRITSAEMQAAGGDGRTFVEREANRLEAIRKRLRDAGFVLDDATEADLGIARPFETWVDAETDAIIYAQVKELKADDETR